MMITEMSILEIELDTNSTYHVGIFFYNDSDPDNIEDVTLEIIEEADVHQVFYETDRNFWIFHCSGI